MRKEDMVWLFIYPFPGDFFMALLKLSDFFFFGGFCDRFLMTFKASIDVRHPRKGLGFKEAVTCVTPQPLFQMFFMIERDGLLGLGAKTEVVEEE